MELPIRVVVVFFVAIVVAGSIIYFAEDVFSDSRDRIDFDEEESTKRILRVNSLSQTQFEGLLRSCADQASGVDNTDCFAVKSEQTIGVTVPSNISGTSVNNQFSSGHALFMYYDLASGQIVVE